MLKIAKLLKKEHTFDDGSIEAQSENGVFRNVD
jgi:hypothetical protein